MREIKFRALTEWGWIFWTPGNGDNGFWESNGVFENKTLGEFSGLTDKHGVEIFEGDILKSSSGIQVVEWHFNRWLLKRNGRKEEFNRLDFQAGFFEIIGNVFEHPHLLEKK